jgi:hypothetical protein
MIKLLVWQSYKRIFYKEVAAVLREGGGEGRKRESILIIRNPRIYKGVIMHKFI